MVEVGDAVDWCLWIDVLDEQYFVFVEVSDSGEVALIEQCFGDRLVWVGIEPVHGFGRILVWVE